MSSGAIMQAEVGGVLLAGGRGTRMGQGDKTRLRLGSLSLLEHTLRRAQPQVERLVISSNSDPAGFPFGDVAVIADTLPGYAGPLAGILAAMEYFARELPALRYVASFAADTPWFPLDFVQRCCGALERTQAQVAVASSAGREHRVFALWSLGLHEHLRRALCEQGIHGVGSYQHGLQRVLVEWGAGTADPFFNINTPEDLQRAESMLAADARAR